MSQQRSRLDLDDGVIANYAKFGDLLAGVKAVTGGSTFIDAFIQDLRQAFPEIGGFSSKNLRYCRAFFRFYCDPAIWQQAVAKLRDIPSQLWKESRMTCSSCTSKKVTANEVRQAVAQTLIQTDREPA